MTIILIAGIVVCAVGWLNRYVCCAALISYMQEKEYAMPSDSEMTSHLAYVWKKVLHIK